MDRPLPTSSQVRSMSPPTCTTYVVQWGGPPCSLLLCICPLWGVRASSLGGICFQTPQSLSDQNTHCPGTPRMPPHGRRRQEHPDKAIAAPLCMVLPRLGGGSATSRWPWRSDPRVSTAKARIRPLASRGTARRRADPAQNRRCQARLADASDWRQTA